MRTAEINRKTNETDIALKLNIDGKGDSRINSGCGFLDHMLTLLSRHARFDLELNCKGDTEVDYHHTVEDIGIALGEALSKALGDKRGITRYGSFILPMAAIWRFPPPEEALPGRDRTRVPRNPAEPSARN